MTAAGNVTRTCHDNQIWDGTDVDSCQSQFITGVLQEVTLPLGWRKYFPYIPTRVFQILGDINFIVSLAVGVCYLQTFEM